MQRPQPQDYGLSPSDLEDGDRWLKRASYLPAATGMIGAVIGAFVGEMLHDRFWIIGLFVGASVGASRLDGAAERVLEAYRRFKADSQRYEDAREQDEERELRVRTQFWTTLPGHRFETELGRLFDRHGYEVTKTPGSGDGGVDLILKRSGRTIVVQCKQSKNPVGPPAARELHSVLVTFGADEGILAATGGVTKGVNDFFRDKPLRVMGLDEIIAIQRWVAV